jgi:hypothetical protein
MSHHASICKETFLLQEFMQADLVANSAINEQDASIGNSKFLRRLRFVSQSIKP